MPVDRVCCVKNCKRNSVSDREAGFYTFPKNPQMLAKWKENLRIQDDTTNKLLYVCGIHFDVRSKGSCKLKIDAIPTLDLGYEETPPHNYTPNVKRSCCVPTCRGPTGILYEFPKTEVARNTWALICKLSPSAVAEKKHYICERHFDRKYVSKKRLLEGALPKYNLEQTDAESASEASSVWEVPPIKRTYLSAPEVTDDNDITFDEFQKYSDLEEKRQRLDIPNSDEGLDDVELVCDHQRFAEQAQSYQRNASKLEKLIKELKQVNETLKERNDFLEKNSIIPQVGASEDAIIFAKMIVHVKNTKYKQEEKSLAQNICYMSSKAYGFMRDELGFRLPHQRSLLRWRPIRYVRPGIDENVVANLKNMIGSMPESHRICQMTWDEIGIKRDLTYNQVTDVIDGFVDKGRNEREMLIGDKCLFFMIKGICSKWKYVLSYYIAQSTVRGNDLVQLIKTNIEVAQSIGLQVKATVCDQGTANQAAFRILGITKESTYILYKEAKIHFMYDYCHLIKSMRNTFLNNKEFVTQDGTVMNKVVKKLYEIDKANDHFKICPKLTDAHVYPSSFERMSVSRATQLLSNSVSAGIEMCHELDLLGNDENLLKNVKPTQIFIKRMNDLFDELDCKFVGNKNPLKWPMRRDCGEKAERLLDHMEYLESINLKKPCISGFILTLKSMMKLSEDIFENYAGLDFLLLGKLNQDALENFFYKIRASQGLNMHPTAHDIQYIVARLMSMKILRHRFKDKGSNCEDDDDVFLDWNIEDHPNASKNSLDEDLSVDYLDEDLAMDEDPLMGDPDTQLAMEADLLDDIPDELFVEDVPEKIAEPQIQRYYAGFVIYKKIIRKVPCEKCSDIMTKYESAMEMSSEALIKAKNYTDVDDLRLVNPGDEFFELSRMHMKWYTELFKVSAHRPSIKTLLLKYIKDHTDEFFPEWFDEKDECNVHRLRLLEYMVTVLLFKNARWLTRNEEKQFRRSKGKAKLKKL